MFKKPVKRIVAFLLSFVLVFASLPITTIAGTTSSSIKNEDEYIYYSDLFYGYSSYLNSNSLSNHHFQTQMAMSNVFSEYVESPAFGWAGFSETLNLFSSMSDLAKAYTDKFGLTDFQYKDDLDTANRKFASNLFALKMSAGDGLSNIGKTSKKFDSVISTIEKLYKAKETDTMILSETITLVLDDTKLYCNYTASFIPSLNEYILTYLDNLSDPLDTTSEIFEFASALATAIVMEDVRLELISDVIKTQEKTSILYEGMSRLYSQLRNGYIDYFVETYFTNKIIDKVAKGITKNVQNILLGSINGLFTAVTSCVGLINDIVFDWILGDTFSTLEDYRVTMILAQYSDLIYDSVINKQTAFTAQFENSQIKEYEILFEAYLSATEYALEQCGDLAYYNTTYDSSYIDDKIYTWCKGFSYYDYINNVKYTIKSIPYNERNFVNFGELKLTNIKICYGSDKITNNCFYFVNGECNANVEFTCLTIDQGKSFTVNGDVFCYTEFINNGELTVCGDLNITRENTINNGTFNVLGNVNIDDNSYFYDAKLYNYGTMNVLGDFYIEIAYYYNKGITKIKGDLIVVNSSSPLSGAALWMENPEAELYVAGDIDGDGAFIIKDGTIILNGTQQQTVSGLKAKNLIIDNPYGIKYIGPVYLYGSFDSKGNPIDNNGHSTYLYSGATLTDNYDYGKLSLEDDMELTGNFKADLFCASSTLTIPEGENLIIDGNVSARDTIKNNGTFEVKGNLDFTRINLFIQNDEAVLKVGGNLNFGSLYYSTITNGTIILNGTQQQTVSGLKAKNLIIDNPYGIKYTGSVYLYGSFDSKGNPIDNNGHSTYLYSGATLTDNYDYGKLSLEDDMELTGNFKADLFCASSTLTIPEGENLIIDGNVSARDTIKNNGTFEVKGNLDITQQKLFIQNDEAVLKVGGNLNFGSLYYSTITNGTIILNGTQQQTVTSLRAKKVVIENESEEGIVFNSNIFTSVLFNHNQNNFTLYNNGLGSSFADYDDDGLKDNLDPSPTIPHICQEEGHMWIDATCITPKTCMYCGEISGDILEHTYDNDCDAECNGCKQIRTAPHYFEWVIDKYENCGIDGEKHEECNICHTTRNENTVIPATGNHNYDNACDTNCNICGATRKTEHTYDNDRDAFCNNCLEERELYIYGDANGDKKIDAIDLAVLRKYLAYLDFEIGESVIAVSDGADANGDGTIDSIDLAMLRSYLAYLDFETNESSVVLGPKS